jgi:long-chain acyl-CoA synthetase
MEAVVNTKPLAAPADLAAILARSTAAAPGSVAVIRAGTKDGEHTEYTFGELTAAATRVSARLIPGTRVVIRLDNSAASVVAIQAAWSAGCSVVSAGVLVPDAEVTRRTAVTKAASTLVPDAGQGLDVAVEHTGADSPAPSNEALVMFTSGTTGIPKAASLTFSALRGSVAGIAGGSGIADGGRPPRNPARGPQLVLVPIALMGGFLGVLSSWWLGKPVLLAEKFSVPLVIDLANRYRLGVLRLTPAMVWELVQSDVAGPLPGVTSATVGTAALPEATRLAFEAKFGVPVLRNYGQTEFAGAIAFERVDDVAAGIRPDNTVGRIAPGVEVVILGTDGEPVGNGEIGEIAAGARSAMSGYLDSTGVPADAGTLLRTGDLGVLSDDGFLSVVGRVRDMVVCGGFNIYPAQVEAALNALPDVADSAVAGIPDDRLGEVPVAAVIPAPGSNATAHDIKLALRTQLAVYEVPRAITMVESLPRTDIGKLDRPAVARLFGVTPP